MTLNGKQRRYLRGLGHELDPVVQLGKDGLTDGVVAALGDALETHELIKVKFGQNFPEDKDASAEEAARRAGAELVQVLGSTALLYRKRAEDPSIKLPR